MKHLFSALLAVAMIPLTYWAQTPPLASSSFSTEAPTGYWLETEAVTSHTGGALDGMTTYRVYLNTINATDYLSSCSGEQANPLVFTSSSGSWYNDPASTTWNALGINSAFFDLLSRFGVRQLFDHWCGGRECPCRATSIVGLGGV